MTDELESRLRRHLRVVDDTEVASTADVASSARRFAARRRRRSRVAAGAASVVAIVVAGAAVVAILPDGSGEVSIGSNTEGVTPDSTSPSATLPVATSSTPVTTTSPPAEAETSAWTALPPDPRGVTSSPSVVWTGTEAIAIGGLDDNGEPRISAAAFDPATETWRTLQDPSIVNPVIAAQFTNQLVVWTGTEVLVLGGGSDGPRRLIALGGHSYDPVVDEWRSVPIPFPTGPVSAHTPSVWTGIELLVWTTSGPAADAGTATAFDPVTDTWRELSAPPVTQREHAASVWTGTEWIIWGGHRDGSDLDDGVAYDPATDTWRIIADSPLSPRRSPAVWTGTEMLVVSGSSGNQGSPLALADGAAYDPVTDSWRPIADGFAHPGFVPVWTGTELVLFAKGGAVVYDPGTDRWIDTCCDDTGGGSGGTPVWTGSTIVLLGSDDPNVGGSIFSPTRTITVAAPSTSPSTTPTATTAADATSVVNAPGPGTVSAKPGADQISTASYVAATPDGVLVSTDKVSWSTTREIGPSEGRALLIGHFVVHQRSVSGFVELDSISIITVDSIERWAPPPGWYVELLDVGFVDGDPMMLVTTGTQPNPYDADVRLLLVDLTTRTETDLGPIGGWETGASSGVLGGDSIALKMYSSAAEWVDVLSLDGSHRFSVELDDDRDWTVSGSGHTVWAHRFEFEPPDFSIPIIVVHEIDLMSGQVQEFRRTLVDATGEPLLETGCSPSQLDRNLLLRCGTEGTTAEIWIGLGPPGDAVRQEGTTLPGVTERRP